MPLHLHPLHILVTMAPTIVIRMTVVCATSLQAAAMTILAVASQIISAVVAAQLAVPGPLLAVESTAK